jgi:alkylation response protein AidB-like acyl-CoA dehydrogenase
MDSPGWRAADVCRANSEDVHVPAGRLIGKPGRALPNLMRALEVERLVAGVPAVGGAAHSIELLDQFVRAHRVEGRPLGTNPSVRQRIADLQAQLDLVRQCAYHAAWTQSRGILTTGTASILKLKATELAVSAAGACMQIHGAQGYLEGSVAARVYRDAAGGTIAGGPSEVLHALIFEAA